MILTPRRIIPAVNRRRLRRTASVFLLLNLLQLASGLAVQPNDPKDEWIQQIKQAKADLQKAEKDIADIDKQSIDGLSKEQKEQYEKDQQDLKDAKDAYDKQFTETQKLMDEARENPEKAQESETAQDKLSELAQKTMKLQDKIKKTQEEALDKLSSEKKKKLEDAKTRRDNAIIEGTRAMDEYRKYTGRWPPIRISVTRSDGSESLLSLASAGQVKIKTSGTGETIGHVADLIVENLTDQPINCVVPPMILESSSGKNQHYACPKGVSVALNPHQEKTVPMDGVCVNRNKPPVGKGVSGDLLVNEGNPNIAQDPQSHLKAKDADKLLRIATSKYDAADKLQKDGALKDLPYHDKQKQKDIVVQWSTWTDPQISEITGAPPATKEDLKKVVYKQVEQNGPMTPETKKKVDQGIDTIFEKVELTTEKAKDLEKPDANATDSPGPINVSDETPTPAPPPQTQEKPKKYKFPVPYVTPQTQDVTPQTQEKAPKKWPKPIQDWVDKKKAAADADFKKKIAQHDYTGAAYHFFYEKSKHYREVYHEKEIAKEKKDQAFRTQEERLADQDKIYKADKELKKLEGELEKDFRETPEGQKKSGERNDAEKAADKAHDAEKEAGKNIDPATKEAVAAEEAERDKKAAETERAERDRKAAAAEAETDQAERDRKAAGTDDQKKDEKPRP